MEASMLETSEITGAGGTPDALFELGLMHCAGRDGALDLVNAHKWFNLAAMRGNDAAKQYRMEISREMSRTEVAREWLARH
jgi:TPR repeat protein